MKNTSYECSKCGMRSSSMVECSRCKPTPQPASAALEALDIIDETIGLMRSCLNDPPEFIAMNAESMKADLDGVLRLLRKHGATWRGQALAQCGVPEGYVLVPKEPDMKTILRMVDTYAECKTDAPMYEVYKAMIAAAPVVKGE